MATKKCANGVKRKYRTIPLQVKVQVLKKLDQGIPPRDVCAYYGISASNVCYIKMRKHILQLAFCNTSDSSDHTDVINNMYKTKSEELHHLLVEWIHQRRKEGVIVSENMLTEQGKIYHKELELKNRCTYGRRWLQRFKKRHGISLPKVCGERLSPDKGADSVVDLEADLYLSSEQELRSGETSSESYSGIKDSMTKEGKQLEMLLIAAGIGRSASYHKKDEAERHAVNKLIKMTDELIKELEGCSILSKQEIIVFDLLHEKLHNERSKHMNQYSLDKMSEKKRQCDNEPSESNKRGRGHDSSEATSTPVSTVLTPHDDKIAPTETRTRTKKDKIADDNFHHTEHSKHQTLILSHLLEDATFADVTLTAEGQSLKAHKAVLSAISSYFKRVLQNNPSPHPIIIMPLDMQFGDLKGIIDYIYMGKITEPTKNSTSLKKAAQILQISGFPRGRVSHPPLSIRNAQSAHPDVLTNQPNGISVSEDANTLQLSIESIKSTESSAAVQNQLHEEESGSTPSVEAGDPLDTSNQMGREDLADLAYFLSHGL
ncbi:uncharacterized protein LOC122254405 isoform X2 [Penaeus japonicus]|uniref:uncharacterized protein LOC122254405 isoform X2 n=1 Tax=Penaeus japonicus TaxID=27405 RepID=UPI001C70CA80|nr:uncharacterized protein LOC122254405 isoform X2 [Penaeus japonicus]